MYQTRTTRKTAEETNICQFCVMRKRCENRPESTDWRHVLNYCAGFIDERLVVY